MNNGKQRVNTVEIDAAHSNTEGLEAGASKGWKRGFIVGIFQPLRSCICFYVFVCAEGQLEGYLHPVLTLSDSAMMSFRLIWSQTDCPSISNPLSLSLFLKTK